MLLLSFLGGATVEMYVQCARQLGDLGRGILLVGEERNNLSLLPILNRHVGLGDSGLVLLQLVMVAVVLGILHKRKDDTTSYVILICMLLILSPFVWYHYYTWVMPGLFLLWVQPGWRRVVGIAGYLIIGQVGILTAMFGAGGNVSELLGLVLGAMTILIVAVSRKLDDVDDLGNM